MCLGVKKYSPDIPLWLQNRPHNLITHCMNRLAEVDIIHVTSQGDSMYSVSGNIKAQYEVSMSSASCSCYDFCTSMYPCKHILAVMHHTKTAFDDIPGYKDNPWFVLDEEAMFPALFRPTTAKSSTPSTANSTSNPASDTATSIPVSHTGTKSPAALTTDSSVTITRSNIRLRCCETLKQIENLTYHTDVTEECLSTILSELEEMRERMKTHLPVRNNLIVSPSTHSNTRRTTQRNTKPPKPSRMPTTSLRKSWKHRLPMKAQARLVSSASKRNKHRVHHSTAMGSQLMTLVTLPTKSDKQHLMLNPYHQLTDRDIDTACDSIARQWPDTTIQSTLLIQMPNQYQKAGKYCQVLHDSIAKHWIAISNIKAQSNHVKVMDSLGLTIKDSQLQAIASKIMYIFHY